MHTWQLVGAGLGSFVLAWLAVRLSIRVANETGALDAPDGDRKIQKYAVPRLGGIAVAVSFSIASVAGLASLGLLRQSTLAVSIVIPALLASVIGLVDDHRNLSPRVRLGLQACVGAIAFSLGTQATLTGNSLVNLSITVFWVVLIINGMNLLDNSDGLAGSTALIAGLASLVIALILQQSLIAVLAISLVGVAAGFLVFNWFPARVYLGDSGAYFLGTLLALLIIRLRPAELQAWEAILVAALIVALPIVDTTYVVIRRLIRGVHPFTAGRDHLSHKLQRSRMSVAGSVVVLQAFSLMCGGLAVALLLYF